MQVHTVTGGDVEAIDKHGCCKQIVCVRGVHGREGEDSVRKDDMIR